MFGLKCMFVTANRTYTHNTKGSSNHPLIKRHITSSDRYKRVFGILSSNHVLNIVYRNFLVQLVILYVMCRLTIWICCFVEIIVFRWKQTMQ